MLAAFGATAAAQTGGGATLVGTVKDSTGATVAGAKVSVLNTGTAFLSETTTGADGGYYVPYLAAGSYKVTIEAQGFNRFVRDGITLRPGEVPRVDIALELGAVTESIAVTAELPALDTENIASGFALSKEDLPKVPGLMKRSVYLLQFMPGIVGIVGQGGFHIAGQAQNASNWTLDGISAKAPCTGTVNEVDGVLQPSLDAIEEFKVQVSGNFAENGHTAGGSVRAVYKSGTNALHGSFEQRGKAAPPGRAIPSPAIRFRAACSIRQRRSFSNSDCGRCRMSRVLSAVPGCRKTWCSTRGAFCSATGGTPRWTIRSAPCTRSSSATRRTATAARWVRHSSAPNWWRLPQQSRGPDQRAVQRQLRFFAGHVQ